MLYHMFGVIGRYSQGDDAMQIIQYFMNIIRLGVLALRRKYKGPILQAIPMSTVIRAGTGFLELTGKLSCRKNSYLSAGKGHLSVGRGCFINQNVMVVSMQKITIGNDVIIGPNVVIVDHDHDYHSVNQENTFTTSPIHIGNNVWIGANVTILKGTILGDGCVVGAGVTLKGTYPENTLLYQEAAIETRSIERKKQNA